MRILIALLLCWTASLDAQGPPVPIEFLQTWPVDKTGSGISAAGNVDFVPHGATARDPDYPYIGLTDEVKVVSNLLDANSDYANAGVVIDRGLGPVAGNGDYPDYINADRRLWYYADYQISAASLAANTFAPVLGLHVTAGGSRLIALYLKPDGGGDWLAEISTELWNESDISDDSTTILTADIQDKRIRFKFDLTPGTMDAGGSTVQDDGSLIVSMIDLDTDVETILYTFTNRSFYLSWIGRALGGGSTVPANNALAVMAIGYAGLIGQNELVAIASPDPSMPETGSLVDHSEPCCDTHGGPNAGPVLTQLATTWAPTLEGGGTIDDPGDLSDAEDWTDQTPPKEPDSWLTIEEEPQPVISPTDATSTKWGLEPYSDPGRLVEARLKEVGAIERGSSDKSGNYAPARARFVVGDPDASVRDRLGDTRRRHLLHREARYDLISYAGRKAELAPMPVIQGRVVDVQPSLDRTAVVEVQDIVGSHFGILNPNKMVGLPIGDEHENLPDDTKGHIYSILLGEHFDIPARDCGDYDFEVSPLSGPIQLVSAPRNLTGELIGAGSGSRTYHYGIVGLTEFGNTVMSNIVSVSGCPDSLDVDTYVELNWDPPTTGADLIIAYWVLGRTASTPNKRLDTMNNGGTFVNPETTYRDGRQGSRTDFDREKTVNFKYAAPATAPASNAIWTWFAVALGEVPILKVFGSDLKEGGVPERVELDINSGDLLTPESDAWPEDDPYRVVDGIRQSGFWARGPRVAHHRDGIVTFTCNTGGWKGTNGLLINQAFLMLYRFLNDAVEKDDGVGYRDGDFGPCETFSDGRPKFHISKFLEAQALSAQIMANAGSPADTGSPDHGSPGFGFIGKMFVIEPTPLGEVLRRFFHDFGGHMTSHRCGAMYPYLIDPTTDAASGPIYRERQEIGKVLSHEIDWREQENRITYDYQYSPDQGLFGSLNNTLAQDDSIAAYGGDPIGVFQDGSNKPCYYGSDPDTMAARWQMALDLYAYAPRYVTWQTDLKHVQRDNGDEVRFSDRKEALGLYGEHGTPGVLLSMTYREQPKSLEMRVRLLDPVLREAEDAVIDGSLVADDDGATLVADDDGATLVEG